LPVVGCALIASLWDRLADAMRWTIARPMSLLVTVNLLNLADAVLTRFAVSAGAAVELNPVVRLIGLPAKLLLVGLLSWLLYRRRQHPSRPRSRYRSGRITSACGRWRRWKSPSPWPFAPASQPCTSRRRPGACSPFGTVRSETRPCSTCRTGCHWEANRDFWA